jgi:hypothetical protein
LSSRVVMGLRVTKSDEKSLGPATTLRFDRCPFLSVIPSEAERSAVLRAFPGNVLSP